MTMVIVGSERQCHDGDNKIELDILTESPSLMVAALVLVN